MDGRDHATLSTPVPGHVTRRPPRSCRARRLASVVLATALLGGVVGVVGTAVEAVRPDAAPAAAEVPGGLGYTALTTPCRAADTRSTSSPTITPDTTPVTPSAFRNFAVTSSLTTLAAQGGPAGGCGVPSGIAAVEVSITVVNPVGTGFLRAYATAEATPNATFINYTAGRGVTNTGTVPVSPARSISDGSTSSTFTVRNYGGTISVAVDVLGYYTTPDGASYVPLGTACKAVDTRTAGGRLTATGTTSTRAFQLSGPGSLATQGGPAGGCGVPDGVPAVEATLTVIDPTGANGFARLVPNGTDPPGATINYTVGTGISNTGTIRLASSGVQDVTVRNFGGSVQVRIDVVGYFTTTPGQGTRYQTVTPCRTVDTRQSGGAMGTEVTRTFQTGGQRAGFAAQGTGSLTGCGVPQRASAVEAAVTAITPTGTGFTRTGPAGSAPQATVLNFTSVGGITNVGTIALSTGGLDDLALTNYGGGANYAIDVLGYFEPFTSVPIAVESVASGGDGHSCAVLSNGTVECWGDNQYLQLGTTWSSTSPPTDFRSTPSAITGITDAVQVVTGKGHACALRTGGTVQCWGLNTSGQVGLATTTFQTAVPTTVAGLTGVVQITAGDAHTCALLSDRTLRCWGEGGSGQLGYGGVADRTTPTAVAGGITSVAQVTAGLSNTCASRTDGTAVCWGANLFGQAGTGTATALVVLSPAPVSGLTGVSRISSGGDSSCAVVASGATRCWGTNALGQFANATSEEINASPVTSGFPSATRVSVGRYSTCVTLGDGTVRCSGQGELGNGSAAGSRLPVQPTSLNFTSEVSVGYSHTCVTQRQAVARCWGQNGIGQVGDGTTTTRLTPVPVSSLP